MLMVLNWDDENERFPLSVLTNKNSPCIRVLLGPTHICCMKVTIVSFGSVEIWAFGFSRDSNLLWVCGGIKVIE